jgi:methyl-accepting chemotaxis protein
MSKSLKYVETYLSQLAGGELPVKIDQRLLMENSTGGRLLRQIKKITDNLYEKSDILAKLAKGELPSVSPSQKDDPLSHSISQIIHNNASLASESREVHDAVLAGDLNVRARSQQLPGFYGEIAESINENLDTIVIPVEQVHKALKGLTINDFTSRITGEFHGQIKVLTDDMNVVCERLTALADSVGKIARGDTSDLEKYRKIVRRSEADKMIPSMLLVTQNIENLVSTIGGLVKQVSDGNVFSAKADPGAFEGEYKTMVEGINRLLECFTGPLSGTLELLSAIAVNDYTHDADTNLKGDFAKLSEQMSIVMTRLHHLQEVAQKIAQGDISELENFHKIGRRSENDQLVPAFTHMMESINGLIVETGNIAGATSSGNFDYVCHTEQFQGEFKKIIVTFEGSFGVMGKYIKELIKIMQAMSVGDLHMAVDSVYEGQLKTLADAVNLTTQRLSTVVGEITEALTSISEGNLNIDDVRPFRNDFSANSTAINKILSSLNEVLGNINQTAEQVAAGSSQVSAGSQSLSQGTSEQASSVEELTSSITEIAMQVRDNAANAVKAKEISENVRTEAKNGDEQMKLMLGSMSEINEGSSNISKIIKVIDDIAFQTNILALNAAVEAARAGQAGKGFAVVAEEVRNLAARSANAANETTTLIEGNIKKVEVGTKIANETASKLGEIVSGIEKSAALISSIAVASNQQATGIAQIDTGIEQVSTVVQTNSSTSEESAAASEELSGQADMLKQMVGRFHLRSQGNYEATRPVEKSHEPTSDAKHAKISLDGSFGKY